MTRDKFVKLYLEPSTASTQATRRATKADILAAQPSGRIDWHADKSTDKE